ncbi:hypothetical protein [Antarcticirhabdus aurantiaca]|uniref:Uncharacterized protein n=1 Tax=Antarcticirhabdus aurantiaca TaxID=2606717 RepID=A0ACD4NJY2_9HYPH|nr:hypothetical protein [Antarcticirhabdus aurantiaca]WAJ27119.1 hypothetical protein OXU80_20015 [Jeongeuplla avenae]
MREMTNSARETLLLALRLRAQSVDPTDGTIMREAADMIEHLIIETGYQRAAFERKAIKLLDWNNSVFTTDASEHKAWCFFGRYHIRSLPTCKPPEMYQWSSPIGRKWGNEDTLEAAKAAAQADLEHHIASTFSAEGCDSVAAAQSSSETDHV